MKSIKINENLYVNTNSVEVEKKTEIYPEQSNQFLIFDRSGSMYNYINHIVKYTKDYVKKLSECTTVSIGYFSNTGEYNVSIPYVLKKELDGCISYIDTMNSTYSLTNFIQVLDKLNKINENAIIKPSLFFFTDGYHNSGGSKKDLEEVLIKWKSISALTTFVGYGYIDRDMMTWMANITNGSFIHLDKFNNINDLLDNFNIEANEYNDSQLVEFDNYNEDISFPLSIHGKNIITYKVNEDGKFNFKIFNKEYKGYYFLTTHKPNNYELVSDIDIKMERGIRALALAYSQKNNVEISLQLLNYLGDKFLIRNLFNSITADEFAKAETHIRKSIYSKQHRFLEGTQYNYLPADDTLCVMDVIYKLIDDENTLIYMNDKDVQYNRLGTKRIRLDGASIKYDNKGLSFNDIVMNKNRLNFSISTYTTGTVDLLSDDFKTENKPKKEELDNLNIDYNYKVNIFKTYTIIADGKLNVEKIVVSDISKDTINYLTQIITRREDNKYIIDLSSLPLINKTYVKDTSAISLAKKLWKQKLLKDQISTYKYLLKNDVKNEEETTESLNDKQQEYLENHCYIKNNSYSPPYKMDDKHDVYEAYTFDVKIKGFSNVTASSVCKKILENKKITDRQLIVEEVYKNYKKLKELTPLDDFNKMIEKIIKNLNTDLNLLRKDIQNSKLAIILVKKGKMDEFDSRENQIVKIDTETVNKTIFKDVEFTFKITKIKVQI